MKWVRHRCQLAPGNTASIAETRPLWESEITRCTPDRPRAERSLRKAFQAAPVSSVNTSSPSISRCPSELTAVATTTAALAHPYRQRVDPHVGVGARVERPRTERGDLVVEALGHARDLRA